MTLPAPPTGLYPEDYERIEAAVMETVRGRWFLLEYARRQRAEETERLIVAVDRLERAAARIEEREAETDWRLPRRLVERAQEFSQTLRASGVDEKLCAQADALAEQFSKLVDALARNQEPRAASAEIAADRVELAALPLAIGTIVSQEAVAQEGSREEPATVELLRDAEPIERGACEPVAFEPEPIARIEAAPPVVIVDGPDVAETSASKAVPAEADSGSAFAFEEFRARAILPSETAPARIIDPRLAALSRLDHLTLHEKLRLFG